MESSAGSYVTTGTPLASEYVMTRVLARMGSPIGESAATPALSKDSGTMAREMSAIKGWWLFTARERKL